MQEKSDRVRPRKDTAMTVCACGSLPALAMCCLLIHVGHRRSQLALSQGFYLLVWLQDCTQFGSLYTHTAGRVCTHWAFLTSTSCIPGMSLYGQSDQYLTHFIPSLFPNIPTLSALTGDTKQRPGSSCWSPAAIFSLSLQLQLTHTKLSTCLVRISSLGAL